jgi:predicted nucleotide-binding protein with TIR-like domain
VRDVSLGQQNVENTHSRTQKPIEIYVSSPWSKSGESTVPIRQDRRWAFLRSLIKTVIEECHSRAQTSPGEYKLDIRLHRLRGRQGMNLLSTLRERIERADVLVMDLAGHNPNVLIEVGMAVAMYKGESGALIILKPKNEPWPSNLQGIVYCNYDKSLRRGLEDQAGFRAALRTRILKVAKERQMLGSAIDAI